MVETYRALIYKNIAFYSLNIVHYCFIGLSSVYTFTVLIKGQLRCKMNLWSNSTLLPSQPFSEICFHDC